MCIALILRHIFVTYARPSASSHKKVGNMKFIRFDINEMGEIYEHFSAFYYILHAYFVRAFA